MSYHGYLGLNILTLMGSKLISWQANWWVMNSHTVDIYVCPVRNTVTRPPVGSSRAGRTWRLYQTYFDTTRIFSSWSNVRGPAWVRVLRDSKRNSRFWSGPADLQMMGGSEPSQQNINSIRLDTVQGLIDSVAVYSGIFCNGYWPSKKFCFAEPRETLWTLPWEWVQPLGSMD